MRSSAFLLALVSAILLTMGLPASADDDHRLSRGDRVKISVLNEPDVTKEATLDAEGSVSLSLLGRVKLAGMTCTEASESIREALAEFIIEPDVSVELLEVGKKRVFVVGEVKNPGSVMLEPDARLIEALGTADYLETADLSKITIQRKSQVLTADLTLYLSGEDLTPNVMLEYDDNIVVPRSDMARSMLVLGAVEKPGTIELSDGMTIREAIAAAGGVTPDADTAAVTIKRRGGQESVPVNYERALAGDPNADIAVSPGDTVFVPEVDDAYFTIQGGVKTPGRYPLRGKMTIEDATAVAGGLTGDALIDRIELIRTTGGTLSTQKVDLKQVRQGKSANVVMQSGDSVVIPTKKKRPDFLQIIAAVASLGWLLAR